ncbi:MAG: pyruvate, phosphate dikinase [Candidatus Latescibacteria bacterium 4484_7]|nr:MAG: pyruvate, phosphate dikinase [Candidatus Latescibacteria bacterium 4484_7]
MSKKYVYFFGNGKAEGNAHLKDLLGGKGANLAEMTNLGIPVPAGFTISTEVCTYFYEHGGEYPKGLKETVAENLSRVEEVMGKRFGDPEDPLLVSVRSGARVSMPGMMDTVLNLGLNHETVKGLAKRSKNERFAYDCFRRFVQMYGDVVLGMKPEKKDDIDPFEEILNDKKKESGVERDIDLSTEDLKDLIDRYIAMIKKKRGIDFPTDPEEQLWQAIGAVFNSWNNERAITYRKLNSIPDDWGTAVNVQSMVFGNLGEKSGTGVAFTRNPATGENVFYGEYLMQAQGEDVVAGIRTPQPINKKQKGESGLPSLEEEMPEIYAQLEDVRRRLEKHYRDMQDIEFTIQDGKLWILQTRTAKRTGFAAIRISVDMVREGLISKEEAIMRIEPEQLNQFLQPIFDDVEKKKAVSSGRLLAHGINAGPGAASGKVVFSAVDAEEMAAKGEDVILVRIETSPEDIKGMSVSKGILTSAGGATSHAALVGRQMGKVCVVGAKDLKIDYKKGQIEAGGRIVKEGDFISIDGTTGEVLEGKIATKPSEVIQVLIDHSMDKESSDVFKDYEALISWSNEIRKLGVRANADRPDQASKAVAFGAEGIGLCRTEHMFFEGNRIDAVREMILASDLEGRKKALAKLLPMQREDFKGIFEVMEPRPVTIRTLDPPLHEFLPREKDEIAELAKKMGMSEESLTQKVESLREANPMLGHRGCRLGIVYPEITEMQVRAIFEAACELAREGKKPKPEIMIPLVGDVKELESQREVVVKVAEEVQKECGERIEYLVGTMIEIPRAALTADSIATVAQFFSFGTNDLTQTTFGLSRDDAGKFLNDYLEKGIWPDDPFQKLDQEGVGQLMKLGVDKGRSANPDLKVGICGEHGGEPSSVEFCHRIGLNYVSCSPFRVPIAIVAAAQAVLREM